MSFITDQVKKGATGEQEKGAIKSPDSSPTKTIEQKKKEAKELFEAGKITEKGYKLLIDSLDNKAPKDNSDYEEFMVRTNNEIVM